MTSKQADSSVCLHMEILPSGIILTNNDEDDDNDDDDIKTFKDNVDIDT